jgi:hypothetical protein
VSDFGDEDSHHVSKWESPRLKKITAQTKCRLSQKLSFGDAFHAYWRGMQTLRLHNREGAMLAP